MSNVTRRSFLEQSLYVAAAGLAAASSAQGAEGERRKPTTRPTTGPSTRAAWKPSPNALRIAVIGVHGRGLNHVDAYSYHDDVDVAAICDVDENVVGKAQDALVSRGRPHAKYYQDIRKLLDDKSIHAVSIATPNHWHALAAIWAMQAGKDVYVEKPASHNVFEGRQMIAAQEKYNKICQVGTQSRSTKACRQAIEYIRSGGIGKVILSRGLCYKLRNSIGHFDDSDVPPGVDYDIWLGPAPKRPFNKNRFHYEWHWNWDYGNGDIGNQGIHQMDIARWALGRELPTSVVALGGRFGYKDDGQTPNTQLALFDYGDNHLLFEVRGLKTPPLMGVSIGNIVYGTDGFVAFDSDYSKVSAFDNKGKKVKDFKGSGDHFSNFLSAVKSRKQSDLHEPVVEGHMSTVLCHLANISYRLGALEPFSVPLSDYRGSSQLFEAFGRMEQHLADSMFTEGTGKNAKQTGPLKLQNMEFQLGPTLAFDPKEQNFGNNREANELLTREYRAPFVVPEQV